MSETPNDRYRSRGVDLIAEERRRQIQQEGWTPEHDAEHANDDLVHAAVSYALPEAERGSKSVPMQYRASGRWESVQREVPSLWPWSACFWKPTSNDRVRELVKAGALIAAEIDRLQKMETRRG